MVFLFNTETWHRGIKKLPNLDLGKGCTRSSKASAPPRIRTPCITERIAYAHCPRGYSLHYGTDCLCPLSKRVLLGLKTEVPMYCVKKKRRKKKGRKMEKEKKKKKKRKVIIRSSSSKKKKRKKKKKILISC